MRLRALAGLLVLASLAGCNGSPSGTSRSEPAPAASGRDAAGEPGAAREDGARDEGMPEDPQATGAPVAAADSRGVGEQSPGAPGIAPAAGGGLPPGSQEVTTPSGLRYIDIAPGKGPQPARGQTVIVHYTGYLSDGTRFDSSRERDEPLACVLGAGKFIRGWEEGLSTLRAGARRRLIIPPALGYGRKGNRLQEIPPNATVIFDVEVLEIRN